MKALVVDDDLITRIVLQEILSGYADVHSCVDGNEAVQAYRRALERGDPYDLICMDVLMPVMGGIEALKIIRREEELHGRFRPQATKIVIATASDDKEHDRSGIPRTLRRLHRQAHRHRGDYRYRPLPVSVGRANPLNHPVCPFSMVECSFRPAVSLSRIARGATPMVGKRRWFVFFTPLCLVALLGFAIFAQQMSPAGQYPGSLLSGLRWRDVGPMRAGRTYGVAGHASQPDTFYFGSVGGGVWKTENSGRTWFPISDEGIPIGSIGAIAVAPSNPNIVYVGTGEPDIRSQHSYGIGMYQIHRRRQDLDPYRPRRHAPDRTRGGRSGEPESRLCRGARPRLRAQPRPRRLSLDRWRRHLEEGPLQANDPNNVGAIDLAIDPKNPRVLYASLWATRRPPWSVYAPTNLPGGGLYKSTDGGDTWKQLTGGLPTDEFVGKIGIAVSPSNPNRLWAVVDDIGSGVPAGVGGGRGARRARPPAAGGVYISDDAGATWKLVNAENRLWGRGWYFEAVTVDPDQPRPRLRHQHRHLHDHRRRQDLRSRQGSARRRRLPPAVDQSQGRQPHGALAAIRAPWSAWTAARAGAPGTTSPPRRSITWPPTIAFPTGSTARSRIAAASASAPGRAQGVLTFRNWEPTCEAGESNTVVPDPKDGNILYGSGNGRCDQRFNIAASLGGELPAARSRTIPIARPGRCRRSSRRPTKRSTTPISSSCARATAAAPGKKSAPIWRALHPAVPATLDPVTAKDIDQPMTDRFGVVYSHRPFAACRPTTVWVGTDDGLIHVTRDDGKTWNNVTPPAMTAWSKVSQIEAGHFDAETAYASVDRHRIADNKPYIYRTHDGGKTWQNVVAGIPEGAYVNSVKEDPQAKGLLYAATELRVYVSFNDGAQWQPLQNNMPVTSVRDIVVHGDDLAIATHGRGFWVLDQMTRAAPDRRRRARRSSRPTRTCSNPARPTPSGRAA